MRNRAIASLILSAFVVFAAVSREAEAKTQTHEFSAGQVWTFHLDPKAPAATLTILKVETLEKRGPVVHVSVSAVRTPNGVTNVVHMAFSRDALDRSVMKLVRLEKGPLDLRGYEAWKTSGGGISTVSVNEALKQFTKLSAEAEKAPCTFDREKLLALNEHEFDQDMEGGWRTLAMRKKCRGIAADLVRDYRELHRLQSPILFWHEGQLRAEMGESEDAIRLFQLSRHPAESDTGWNEYVDASVAFLRNDRPAFDKARAALAALPRPANWDLRKPNGELLQWPVNLDVVDELGRCFGKPYSEAYGYCKK